MQKKPKFNPEITRVKLNPEQAVLMCNCYDRGDFFGTSGSFRTTCEGLNRIHVRAFIVQANAASS